MTKPEDPRDDEQDLGLDWDAAAWNAWLENAERERALAFAHVPAHLIGEYRREKQYREEYLGREVLELLQNANDANALSGTSGRTKIVIVDGFLLAANTGRPFTVGGLESLMTSNNSPKLGNRAFVGNRGLGFRALLNWTDFVFISSGGLNVGFDRQASVEWVERIASNHEKLSKAIDRQKRLDAIPAPALVHAVRLSDPKELSAMEARHPGFRAAWAVAESLRGEGYDSVIGLPFKGPEAETAAFAQLDEFRPESILFTSHIGELSFKSRSHNGSIRVERTESTARIHVTTPASTSTTRWELHSLTDKLPTEHQTPTEQTYEITIAVPSEPVENNVLYCFFPTRARFPYGAVVHATVDISANRDHILPTPRNRWLMTRIAEALADVAEKQARSEAPWMALSILTPQGEVDPVLTELDLDAALLTASGTRRLIPRRDGTFGDATTPRARLQHAPTATFGDSVLHTDDPRISQRLAALQLPILTWETVRARCEAASAGLSTSEIADVVAEIVAHHNMPKPLPALLRDEKGETIPSGTIIFLPGQESTPVAPPNWMELRVLHRELVDRLQTALACRSSRELMHKLEDYDVREYSFSNLTIALHARANEEVAKRPEAERKLRYEALSTIIGLWKRREEGEARPPNLRLHLPNRTLSFRPADELYLAGSYRHGTIVGPLYERAAPDSVVAHVTQFDIEEPSETIDAFVEWAGVNALPRVVRETHAHGSPFHTHVIDSLPYPLRLEDAVVESRDELGWARLETSAIDHLEEILASAESEDILAWLSNDPRIEAWRTGGDASASLMFVPPGKQNYRRLQNHTLPSYAVWQLSTTPWVRTTRGRQPPAKCNLVKNLPEGLDILVPRPQVNFAAAILRTNRVDRQAVESVLIQLGAERGLDEVPWSQFYDYLRELPARDPDGRTARSTYRHLLGRTPNGEDAAARQAFREEGMLFARYRDGGAYLPASRVYYADNFSLPPAIEREIPLLDLDARKGAVKVQGAFGCQSIDSHSIRIEIAEVILDPRADALTREIDQLKPYVVAYRLGQGVDPQGVGRVAALEIQLCTRVQGRAMIGENTLEFNLKADDPPLAVGNKAYMIVGGDAPARVLLGDPLVADGIGELLAQLLRLERGSDFARLAAYDHDMRKRLLSRMIGPDAEALLEEARVRLGTPEEESPPLPGTWYEPPPPEEVPPTSAPGEEYPPGAPGPLGSVTVTPGTYLPRPPVRRITRRVRATPTLTPRRRRLANAKRSEELAMKYEEIRERFPLNVAHQQGQEGPGADILSFASAADRDNYQEAADPALVARFIEVKGRSGRTGRIVLEGNELDRASQVGERYWVYAVYETEEEGEYELYETVDPLSIDSIDVHVFDITRAPEGRVTVWNLFEDEEQEIDSPGADEVQEDGAGDT